MNRNQNPFASILCVLQLATSFLDFLGILLEFFPYELSVFIYGWNSMIGHHQRNAIPPLVMIHPNGLHTPPMPFAGHSMQAAYTSIWSISSALWKKYWDSIPIVVPLKYW